MNSTHKGAPAIDHNRPDLAKYMDDGGDRDQTHQLDFIKLKSDKLHAHKNKKTSIDPPNPLTLQDRLERIGDYAHINALNEKDKMEVLAHPKGYHHPPNTATHRQRAQWSRRDEPAADGAFHAGVDAAKITNNHHHFGHSNLNHKMPHNNCLTTRLFDRHSTPTKNAPYDTRKHGYGGSVIGDEIDSQLYTEADPDAGRPVRELPKSSLPIDDPNTKTFDEYQASLQSKSPADDLLQPREVLNDESQFHKVAELRSPKSETELHKSKSDGIVDETPGYPGWKAQTHRAAQHVPSAMSPKKKNTQTLDQFQGKPLPRTQPDKLSSDFDKLSLDRSGQQEKPELLNDEDFPPLGGEPQMQSRVQQV